MIVDPMRPMDRANLDAIALVHAMNGSDAIACDASTAILHGDDLEGVAMALAVLFINTLGGDLQVTLDRAVEQALAKARRCQA